MSNIVIVANGGFPRKEYPKYVLQNAEHLVCCDGALQTLDKMGVTPDAVVGDFDSVCGMALRRFTGVVVHCEEQETNDLSKAFHYALDTWTDITEIHLLAATGKREDHTLGNLALLADFRAEMNARGLQEASLDMISDYSTVLPLTDSTELYVGEGRPVSIISLDPSLRIKSRGLEWPLDEVVFNSWWKATLNRSTSDSITLTFNHPAPVLVFLD